MAFPVVESLTQTSFAANTTDHNVDMPASVTAGDLLVMVVAFDGAPTTTNPSGWTELQNTATNSHARFTAVKIATGSEGGTTVNVVTSVTEQGAAQVYRISNWWGTIATGVAIGTENTGGAVTTLSPPALDPSSWGVEDTLWLAFLTAGTAAGNNDVSGYPASYTNGTETDPGGGGNGALVASARRQNAVASEDAGDFTINVALQGGAAFTIAIRPGAGGQNLTRTILRLSSSSSLTDS